ncbi:MAG: 50S ribosomal protein L25 [Candidatus Nealsonbacteria bacterium]|nr:MAG: 50S ribosomal protein L25 [Candidatus Nealsonbacteria bacterium]
MLLLSAKIRKDTKKVLKNLREKEILPAVLYGSKIKNLNLELNLKEFEKVYKEAGESSLVSLNVEGQKEKFLVLIYDIQFASLSGKPIHVDLYQPALKEEVEVTVPIIIEGKSLAVKNLEGTLVKNITDIEIRALPQKLPKEIKVNVERLKTFDDYILIKDLQLPEGVKVLRDPEEILISVSPPEKVEEEKPAEEKPKEEEKKEEEEKIEEKKIEEKKKEPFSAKATKGEGKGKGKTN